MLADIGACLRFYTRLPVPVLSSRTEAHAVPDFRRLAPVVPVAGLVIGLVPAATLIMATYVGLPATLAATLAVASVLLSTGAFHEDGLADTADSFGASTPARRLEIMRDSRIGTFGAAALVLVLVLRVESIARLVEVHGRWETAAVLVGLAAATRAAALPMMAFLPSARTEGLAYAVGLPSKRGVVLAGVLGTGFAVVLLAVASFPLAAVLAAPVACLCAGVAAIRFARRHVGGHSGDIAGAAQQVAEVAALAVLVAVGH